MSGGLMQLVAYGAQDIYLHEPAVMRGNGFENHEYYHDICKRKKNYEKVKSHKEKQVGHPRQLKRGTTCIISLDEITNNEAFSCCNQCKQIFSWGHIILWLNNNKTCPHCRANMDITNMKKYVNSAGNKKKVAKSVS